jgi:hypothetical protein
MIGICLMLLTAIIVSTVGAVSLDALLSRRVRLPVRDRCEHEALTGNDQ